MAREYTTSQALDLLDKNKTLVFERSNHDMLYLDLARDYKILRAKQIIGVMAGDCNSQTKWKMKQCNISIASAAEAFKQGKNIRCEFVDYGDNKLTQTDHFTHELDGRIDCMREDSPEITFYMISNGKWYIDEEEE